MRAQRAAANGDDHLLNLLVDCIAARDCEYEDWDDEYNYDVMNYYDDED